MTTELLERREGDALILTISNPEARNALHPDIYPKIIAGLERASADVTIAAVVLTGADGMFCAGGNINRLRESRSKPVDFQRANIEKLNALVRAMQSCQRPIIAAVEGAAAGAGFSLTLACDFVVSANDAKFVMAYVNIGLVPDGGGSWSLARMLPRPLANEVIMLGKVISAERLAHFGLVNEVVDPGKALDGALALAARLAKKSPNALARIKELVGHAAQSSMPDHLDMERELFANALHHDDAGEGVAAFLEKRPPNYRD